MLDVVTECWTQLYVFFFFLTSILAYTFQYGEAAVCIAECWMRYCMLEDWTPDAAVVLDVVMLDAVLDGRVAGCWM